MHGDGPTYMFLVMLKVQPAWLALPRQARQVKEAAARALLARHPEVALRWFDAEAFSADCTDVLQVEVADPWAWYRCWEELRDSELFTVPYFVTVRIVAAVEDGYKRFEEEAGVAAG
jgi:hypothetical protein